MDKLKFEHGQVCGIISALRGMRNPLNSWNYSDTTLEHGEPIIGAKDLALCKRLIKGGREHAKFLRQIQVWVDVTEPRYWWSEFDTYSFNSKNSCSTMHTIMKKELTLEDFYYTDKIEGDNLKCMLFILNYLREKYNNTKDYKHVISMKRLLPESYLQKRTLNTNYAELRNIYHQRKNHRLKEEWGAFTNFISMLPYARELIIEE